MRKDLERVIKIPEGLTAKFDGSTLVINGNGKELSRTFSLNKVRLSVEGDSIKLAAKSATKRESTTIGTTWAHINNMIKGLTDGFEYTLEICNVHFPMNVKVDGDKVLIKSFLGEKTDRIASIMPDVEVFVKGSQITVKSAKIESAGQTAANIEKAARLSGRDRRIFQDGIFITEKNGRKI